MLGVERVLIRSSDRSRQVANAQVVKGTKELSNSFAKAKQFSSERTNNNLRAVRRESPFAARYYVDTRCVWQMRINPSLLSAQEIS
jgi:hypothetical protein